MIIKTDLCFENVFRLPTQKTLSDKTYSLKMHKISLNNDTCDGQFKCAGSYRQQHQLV